MAGEREITIRIVGDASKAKSTFQDAGAAAGTFEGKIDGANSKWGAFSGALTGALAGGAISTIGGFLKDAAQAAADDAASTARLQQAVENSGTSWDSYSQQVDDAIKKGQELAFSDDDTRAALTALTQETGSSAEAMNRLHTAQDLARGTGMSLEQAAKLLGKTTDENVNTLKRYGISVEEGATAQDLMNEVDARFGGQAAAFAESGAGQWAILQDKLGEVQESIGAALIPALTAVVGVVSQVVDAVAPLIQTIMDNKAVMIGLAAAIATVLVPAFIAMAVSAGAAAVATIAAFAPIIAVAAAIGVAVGALYLAWSSNFLGIQDITKAVIDFVGPYITTAINAIQVVFDTVWPYIQALTTTVFSAIADAVSVYIAVAQAVIDAVLPVIQAVFETVWPVIAALTELVFSGIASAVTTYIGVAQSVIEVALAAISLVFNTVWPAVQAVVETAMAAIATAVAGISAIYDTIATVLGQIESAFITAWDNITSTVSNAIQGIIDTVSGAASALYDAGANLIQSLINGISDKLQALKNKIGEIGGIIGGIDVPGFSPLGPAGYHMGQIFTANFAKGVEDGNRTKIRPAIADIGGSVAGGGGGGGGGGDTGTIAYYPHESSDKFLYCEGTTAVFENHKETNHPTCGGVYTPSGNGGGSMSLGTGGGGAMKAGGGIMTGGSSFEDRVEKAIERGIRRALSSAT